eukprot:TRINITY_DN6066_c0_g1_i18.p1 TRINITY_DN6066_c0_g1~~TRINITY_DN6066_c0_g1_i18.p1  ORF type:complete len:262 (-),score=52.21 TRINITY_DN6066_c0_g1_i18:2-787(-)
MLRSLVGSEMCIRDRYQRRVRGSSTLAMARWWLVLTMVQLVVGTHYRFGTISHRLGSAVGEVEFTIKLAYRRSFSSAWVVSPIGDTVSSSGRWKLGDGTSVSNPPLVVTAVSSDNDWVFMEGTHTHTYADTSVDYFPEFESCCRISQLLNNPDANYITRAKVSFPLRGNESPVSSGLPILEILQGSVGTFQIPFTDTDSDPVTVTNGPISTMRVRLRSVSYTHLTLPTKRIVEISVVAVSLKKKKKEQETQRENEERYLSI